MTLIRQEVERNNKTYVDFFLCWKYNGKVYKLRVRPVFDCDFKYLGLTAKRISKNESIDKYVE